MKRVNLIISGVGGQGVIMVAVILGEAAIEEELDVYTSEIHGMAQRGGSVVSHVRIGQGIHSASISEGSANAILGFEPAEILRVLRFANPETKIIINTRPITPITVSLGTSIYPSLNQIITECRRYSEFIVKVDALKLALEAGNPLTQNIVLLGSLAATGIIPLKVDTIRRCIRRLVPKRYVEVNLKAFEKGHQSI